MSDKKFLSSKIALAALTLAACALLAVALLGGTEMLTRDRIASVRAQAERDALALVLPPSRYDNDITADQISVVAPKWVGDDKPLSVWRARRAGEPAALVLQVVARDGYAGAIQLRLGVDVDGRVTGVRVVEHKETPGLGDAIEAERSDWILGFTGKSLQMPAAEQWTTRRDGGEFDQFAGATITPRAVVHAIRRALQYVERHGNEIYAAPNGSQLEHPDAP
jgi:electron transport complex protein RnfG